MNKKKLFLCMIALVLVNASGCAKNQEEKNLYAEDFKLAIEGTDSQFLKDVYADGVVTDAERSEARDLFQKCVNDAGLELIYTEPEGYRIRWGAALPEDPIAAKKQEDEEQAKVDKCDNKYYGMLEYLYKAPRDNPQKEDEMQWVVDCLIRNGLEEKDFTVEEFFEKYSSSNPPEWRETPKGDACENDPKSS